MFKISVGSSTDPDTAEAVGALIAQCLARFGKTCPKAGILLNNGHTHDSTILQAIGDTWPQMQLIGSGDVPGGETRLTLMLLDSPDLEFRVGIGPQVSTNPGLAAELALSQSGDPRLDLDRIHMCLTLPDAHSGAAEAFSRTLGKLLPRGTAWLSELLPVDGEQHPRQVDRYYCGRKVLRDAIPVLLASSASKAQAHGWSMTRNQGIVRRECGDQVYEYDTLIGDRRRMARAG